MSKEKEQDFDGFSTLLLLFLLLYGFCFVAIVQKHYRRTFLFIRGSAPRKPHKP